MNKKYMPKKDRNLITAAATTTTTTTTESL